MNLEFLMGAFTKFLEISQFIGVLSFLIFIHELGHYFTAKWSKVRVEEFGLGYPPRAKKLFTWRGTLFSLNWIPFGGFVKMDGEDGPHSVSEEQREARGTTGEAPFYEKSALTRLIIILSGAFMNFSFGVIAFSLYFSLKGIPTLVPNARIGAVAENSPAAQAKLPTNVDIKGIRVNDQLTYTATPQDVVKVIGEHSGEHVTLVTTGQCEGVSCDNRLQEFDLYVRTKEEIPSDQSQGAIGIAFVPVVDFRFYPWYEMPIKGAWYGVKQSLTLGYLIIMSVGQLGQQLIQGRVPQDVAGLVGIYDQGQKAGFFSSGFLELMNFAALISINLAIMNVLPIPALDGGRAVFILLELLIGKKHVQKVEGYVHYGGFLFLITLIILITAKDIRSIFFP